MPLLSLRVYMYGYNSCVIPVSCFWFQFLPNTNDALVVTGAADCKIRVHDLNAQDTTHVFGCHVGRVKRLATAPNIPFMFWSAAEDGTIMYVCLAPSCV